MSLKKKLPKPMKKRMWGYFSPDGFLQVRSIAETKKLSRECIVRDPDSCSYKDYEENGYVLRRIFVNIKAE